MKKDGIQGRPYKWSDRLLGLVVALPVLLWRLAQALFGIGIGILVVLLLVHGTR
ncbi:hypothetical protein SAMN06297129_2659 [Pseudooceanicola antarcticus]|uniref:Uncharacterized protein n=1 Tax=Pseudooceanicola antarcticus TaxID=1247613 RepID=A0A285J3F5_9RHOB|nr:hypothetical protein [Pseudooceanicola antarcticus]SNY53896.1 hypothetical protein SAMN06297129_2659 [Pseudooceanicola antarcticus]